LARRAALAALAGFVAAYAYSIVRQVKAGQEQEPIVLKNVRVQVLNGCGVEGAGGRTADRLRSEGFDVVDVGNARSFDYAETIVIDRRGAGGRAGEVAEALGTDNVVVQRLKGTSYDATVIVGRDLEEARPR